MASGFFAILDDIAALMDDVALTAKIATRKTAGILGDDLAVNAEKATGFVSSRELPVLWSITKGSFVNKIIIVPIALLLNAYFPSAITVILVCGGFYLAFEGVEKIVEFLFHKSHKKDEAEKAQPVALAKNTQATAPEQEDTAAEKAKIKSAVTTDFILSVEIVIIALGTVVAESLMLQIATVSIVALLATVGVYGIVALIVRMDDAGLKLIARSEDKGFFAKLGHILVKALPVIIRILSVVGTIALILVAGGIFVHNIHFIHDLFPTVPAMIKEFGFGLAAGLLAVGLFTVVKKVIALAKQ
jgi:predicted DNA repair protein MutK